MTEERAASEAAAADGAAPAQRPGLLNREQAILAFNRRVLAQAERADVPLLERLRYVTIVSSNLDEFFEVRFADYLEAVRASDDAASRREMDALAADAHALIDDAVRAVQRTGDAGPGACRHRHRQPRPAQCRPAALGGEVLRAAGAAAADPGRAGSGASVPAGGQQEPELHRAPGRPRRLRAREPHRHRQGAARAAARDPAARRAVQAGPAGLRAAVQRDPRASGEPVSGPHRRGVLAVSRHARFRAGGRRGRRGQPAPGAALGPDHAPLRPGGAAGGGQHLPARAVAVAARAVQPARGRAVPRQRAGQSGAAGAADRPG